jgi:hypothetical protein
MLLHPSNPSLIFSRDILSSLACILMCSAFVRVTGKNPYAGTPMSLKYLRSGRAVVIKGRTGICPSEQ